MPDPRNDRIDPLDAASRLIIGAEFRLVKIACCIVFGLGLLLMGFFAELAAISELLDAKGSSGKAAAIAGFGAVLTSGGMLCIYGLIREFRADREASRERRVVEPVRVFGFISPCCLETRILRLPSNGISPFRTYRCERCGRSLTTGSARFVHAIIGLGAGLVFALLGIGLITGMAIEIPIMLGSFTLIVFVYCLRSVIQPSVRRAA